MDYYESLPREHGKTESMKAIQHTLEWIDWDEYEFDAVTIAQVNIKRILLVKK